MKRTLLALSIILCCASVSIADPLTDPITPGLPSLSTTINTDLSQPVQNEGPGGNSADVYGPMPQEQAQTTEPPFTFSFEDNCVIDFPDLSAPGDTITIDCVITSANWDPIGVKAQFGPGEQVYLAPVTENPKHWQGAFTYPRLLPEGDYTMSLKVLATSQNIAEKPLTFQIKNKIAQIIITGNALVSESRVQEELRVTAGEYFTPLKAESDIKRIYATGLFQAATVNAVKDDAGGLSIIYTLQENPVIDEIDITGNSVFVDYTIINKMQTRPGTLLDNEKLRADIRMIEDLYHENEYILAKVKEVQRPSPSDKKKVLTIVISEIKINSVTVKGNKNTKDFTILREMEMKPGLVFDRDMLQTDLRNVFNLNYFKNVYPEVKPSLLDEDLVDIIVNVDEKKTNSVNFGGGYGQLDGWFGFVDLFLDNLWGEARSVLLKAQFGELRTTYQLRYTDPWALPDHTAFTGKIWSSYGYSYLSSYIEQRNGWDIEFSRPLSRHVRGAIHTLYEDVVYPGNDFSDESRRGVGASIGYDTRDYIQNPTQGEHHVLRVDKYLTWFGGTIDNWKYGLTLEKFFPLEKPVKKFDPENRVKQVLATRLLFDIAQGDVPETEEYYVGSDNTIRGYSRLYARGRQRWVGNLEYRYLFNEIFQGVIFYDIGWAGYTSSDFENPQRQTTGKGVGLRINTPLGPIRLDWGWKEEALFQDGYLHFSIGHAF